MATQHSLALSGVREVQACPVSGVALAGWGEAPACLAPLVPGPPRPLFSRHAHLSSSLWSGWVSRKEMGRGFPSLLRGFPRRHGSAAVEAGRAGGPWKEASWPGLSCGTAQGAGSCPWPVRAGTARPGSPMSQGRPSPAAPMAISPHAGSWQPAAAWGCCRLL